MTDEVVIYGDFKVVGVGEKIKWNNPKFNKIFSFTPNRKPDQDTVKNYKTDVKERRQYEGSNLYCTKCKLHHTCACWPFHCSNCNKDGI